MNGMEDIELVIKISKESYKATCRGSMLPPDVENVVNAIKNGTPLPKGHDRLVEAHAVVKALFDHKTIDDVPTIIERDDS